VRAGLLDAGLKEVDGLEEDGREHAGAEAGGEVEGCGEGGWLVGRELKREGGLVVLDFESAVREPSDMAAAGVVPWGGLVVFIPEAVWKGQAR